MSHPSVTRSSERGLTAIETLAAMMIATMVGSTMFSVLSAGTRVFSQQSLTSGLQTDLVGAQTILLDEAMIAGFSPDGVASSLGTFQAATTGTTSDRVQFIADMDSNGISDLLTYEVSSGSLQRKVQPRSGSAWSTGTTETLASNVKSFTLTFLDANRAPVSASTVLSNGTSTARYLRVSLGQQALAKGGDVSRSLLGEVAFRN